MSEWSTIPACPSLMCFFNRADIEGANSLKILYWMFVYVLCKFVYGTDFVVFKIFWFDDLRAELIGDRLNIVFSHDVILCG